MYMNVCARECIYEVWSRKNLLHVNLPKHPRPSNSNVGLVFGSGESKQKAEIIMFVIIKWSFEII